jgi:hypothetical protein
MPVLQLDDLVGGFIHNYPESAMHNTSSPKGSHLTIQDGTRPTSS